MRCPNCQQEIPDTARVCGYCGYQLSAAIRCPHCGAELPAQARACGHCGTTPGGHCGSCSGGWPAEMGEYVILVKKENQTARIWKSQETFTDFTLEADARQVEGPGSAQFGLIFRLRDSDNHYTFLISGDGTFVAKKVNGKWQGVGGIDWTPSPRVQTGGATNHLKVVCKGPKIALYVNGHHLATVSDDSFAEGKVGLIAGTAKGSSPVKVAFDNLVVSEAEAIP